MVRPARQSGGSGQPAAPRAGSLAPRARRRDSIGSKHCRTRPNGYRPRPRAHAQRARAFRTPCASTARRPAAPSFRSRRRPQRYGDARAVARGRQRGLDSLQLTVALQQRRGRGRYVPRGNVGSKSRVAPVAAGDSGSGRRDSFGQGGTATANQPLDASSGTCRRSTMSRLSGASGSCGVISRCAAPVSPSRGSRRSVRGTSPLRLRGVARDPAFREAVTWQNPAALVNAVVKSRTARRRSRAGRASARSSSRAIGSAIAPRTTRSGSSVLWHGDESR